MQPWRVLVFDTSGNDLIQSKRKTYEFLQGSDIPSKRKTYEFLQGSDIPSRPYA